MDFLIKTSSVFYLGMLSLYHAIWCHCLSYPIIRMGSKIVIVNKLFVIHPWYDIIGKYMVKPLVEGKD